MKHRKAKIKPFKGATMVTCESYDNDEWMDFIAGMGYFIYENPLHETAYIISDKTMTYGDLKKSALRFSIDLDWWNNETDLNSMLTEELDAA